MSKKKKIAIIVSSVVVGVLALMILLTFTLFSVRVISVDFRSSTINLNATSQEIVESSEIKKGGSVFFQDKKKYTENLEKTYPYIKVVNIETVFPSKLVIHIVERSEVYAIKYNEKYYICDNDLKVLRIVDEFVSDQNNAILFEGIQVVEGEYSVCDHLEVEGFIDLYEYFYQNNRSLAYQSAVIEKIELSKEQDEAYKKLTPTATLKLFNGQTFKIKNCDRGLKGKTKMFNDVFSQMFEFVGKEITLKDGSKITLSEEILLDSTIEINNYYEYTVHDVNDCYFDIIPN